MSKFQLKFFFTIAYLLLSFPGYAQVANIGFESGNFSGWLGATGNCCPVFTPQPGINTLQYEITTGNATDPFSNGLIPVVAPGSLHSVKLGNNTGSAESERLMTSFVCPGDSMLLVIRYAVILENANHPEPKQPRFAYEVSINGTNVPCNSYSVIAGDPAVDFITNGMYDILPWHSRVIDLRGMGGLTVDLTLETGDCEPGGHFGYAYVDCELIPAEINGTFCNSDGSMTLFAPSQMDHQWWDGSSLDSIHIASPQHGFNYSMLLNQNTGCEITLEKNIDPYVPEVTFTHLNNCDLSVTFLNQSAAPTASAFTWDFGDGNISTMQHPEHLYASPGDYQVSLEITAPNNCRHSETILVQPATQPEAGFTLDSICPGQPFIPAGIQSCATCQYEWFIDGASAYQVAEPVMMFNIAALYQLQLNVTGDGGCIDSSAQYISVQNYPSCDEDYPAIYIPNAFSPNGDGINDIFNPSGSNLEYSIYNRWGIMVFSASQGSQGWNGNFEGSKCPEGVYLMSIFTRSETTVPKRKWISLIR